VLFLKKYSSAGFQIYNKTNRYPHFDALNRRHCFVGLINKLSLKYAYSN